MLEELQQRKQQLKKAAATPEERATIEIVALLFQSTSPPKTGFRRRCGCGLRGSDAGAAVAVTSPTSLPP